MPARPASAPPLDQRRWPGLPRASSRRAVRCRWRSRIRRADGDPTPHLATLIRASQVDGVRKPDAAAIDARDERPPGWQMTEAPSEPPVSGPASGLDHGSGSVRPRAPCTPASTRMDASTSSPRAPACHGRRSSASSAVASTTSPAGPSARSRSPSVPGMTSGSCGRARRSTASWTRITRHLSSWSSAGFAARDGTSCRRRRSCSLASEAQSTCWHSTHRPAPC